MVFRFGKEDELVVQHAQHQDVDVARGQLFQEGGTLLAGQDGVRAAHRVLGKSALNHIVDAGGRLLDALFGFEQVAALQGEGKVDAPLRRGRLI